MNNTTPSWTDNNHRLFAPSTHPNPSTSLPPHCTPTYEFLHYISIATGTCIPTPLAFLSVLLGTLSCISWLFAQLPQLYKNYTIKSTSGLSIFFLIEWCAGDVSNLSGAILTQQATWQVIIGGYYTFVDFMLVAQWIWYEKLQHGRPVRMLWRQRGGLGNHFDNDSTSTLCVSHNQSRAASEPALLRRYGQDMEEAYMASSKRSSTVRDSSPSKPQEIPRHRPREGIFAIPNYGSFQSVVTNVTRLDDTEHGTSIMATPCDRNKKRRALYRMKPRKDDLPSPSPRTVLFITTLVLVLATNASPLPLTSLPLTSLNTRHITSSSSPLSLSSLSSQLTTTTTTSTLRTTLGPLLSWTSTLLYLLSRLPQLLKNHSRRSTAGLSISLFIAAFFGNLFYSASMLANPLFWNSYKAHGCNGWVGEDGSNRIEWIKNAAPFFLGAAGVLMLDAAVAAQFWWFSANGGGANEEEEEGEQEQVVFGVEQARLLGKAQQHDLDASPTAKASVVSARLDSERTLVGSRDSATKPTTTATATATTSTALLAAAKAAAAAANGSGSKPTSLRSEPIHTVRRKRSRSRGAGAGAEPVLVVGHPVPTSDGGGYRWSWKEVDGWMRGWKPSYSNIPLLGEGGGMSGYRSGFVGGGGRRKGSGRPGTGNGAARGTWGNVWGGGGNDARPKSRLKQQVHVGGGGADDDDEERDDEEEFESRTLQRNVLVHKKSAEEVLDGSETQALLGADADADAGIEHGVVVEAEVETEVEAEAGADEDAEAEESREESTTEEDSPDHDMEIRHGSGGGTMDDL